MLMRKSKSFLRRRVLGEVKGLVFALCYYEFIFYFFIFLLFWCNDLFGGWESGRNGAELRF